MAKRITRAARERAIRRGAETRALYAFEGRAFKDPQLTRRRSIGQLRKMATRIWNLERTARADRMPQIVAGRGTRHDGRWISYCEGRRKIELARHERRYLELIHELVHAIGFTTHGPAFRARYFELLRRYGGRLSAKTQAALKVNLRTLQTNG